jgi:hypothetical protein
MSKKKIGMGNGGCQKVSKRADINVVVRATLIPEMNL